MTALRVLVACEFSGTVRDAFARRGWDAWSCDLLPSETPGNHVQGDVLPLLEQSWDLMIAHPPCTHLAVSGAAWFHKKQLEQLEALVFVQRLLDAPIKHRAVENPVSVISSRIRRPNQIIQPWMFGHPEQKTTCLWTEELPLLYATDNVRERMRSLPKSERERMHYLPPSKDRWKLRSTTYSGVAQAMADQWGSYVEAQQFL